MAILVIKPYPEDATVTVNGNTATNNYFTITAGDFALINVSKSNYVTSSSRIQINEDLYLNVRLEKVKDSGGGSGDMNNPMTTQGDIIVGGNGGDPARLGIGSAGEVLKVNSSGTGLEYGTGGGSGDMTNPMTTAGDIIVGGNGGDPARLGIGNDGQILKVVSGALAYADEAAGGMNNPMTTQGDLIVGGTSGTPQRLGIGTAGQILKVNSQANGFEFANESGGGGSVDIVYWD